jgi:hypothetical protein
MGHMEGKVELDGGKLLRPQSFTKIACLNLKVLNIFTLMHA